MVSTVVGNATTVPNRIHLVSGCCYCMDLSFGLPSCVTVVCSKIQRLTLVYISYYHSSSPSSHLILSQLNLFARLLIIFEL